MTRRFRMAKNDEVGENWLIAWTGQDALGNHYNVTTDHVHASELYLFSNGAEKDAELIAELLDWYYADEISARAALALVRSPTGEAGETE